jgi:hypothetical protein
MLVSERRFVGPRLLFLLYEVIEPLRDRECPQPFRRSQLCNISPNKSRVRASVSALRRASAAARASVCATSRAFDLLVNFVDRFRRRPVHPCKLRPKRATAR